MDELIKSHSWIVNPGDGFWIARDGRTFKVHTTHIDSVCAAPHLFNVDLNHIKEVFAHYGEPLGHEGYAREQILVELIQRGRWIRLRHSYRRGWSVTLPDLDIEVSRRLSSFFDSICHPAGNDAVRMNWPRGHLHACLQTYCQIFLPYSLSLE